MKISKGKIEHLRQQAIMDWFRDHQHELTYAQAEYYESVKKQLNSGHPLTDKQMEVMNNIKTYLSPDADKELIIRINN